MKYLVLFKTIECGTVCYNERYEFSSLDQAQNKLDELFDCWFEEDNNDSGYSRDEAYDGRSFEFLNANGDTIIGELVY